MEHLNLARMQSNRVLPSVNSKSENDLRKGGIYSPLNANLTTLILLKLMVQIQKNVNYRYGSHCNNASRTHEIIISTRYEKIVKACMSTKFNEWDGTMWVVKVGW